MELYQELIKYKDEKYNEFNKNLIPNRNKDFFIGIRIPILRKFAKTFFDDERKNEFLSSLPHKYFEENLIHRYLIEDEKDYSKFIEEINILLPFLESWAETDGFRNKTIENNLDRFLIQIKIWLKSDKPYIIRFAINMLMTYYLDDNFKKEYLSLVLNVKDNNHYYVKMMQAWYYATSMIGHFDETIEFLLNNDINTWTFNKTIQKAIESFRINDEKKEYLKTLKK